MQFASANYDSLKCSDTKNVAFISIEKFEDIWQIIELAIAGA